MISSAVYLTLALMLAEGINRDSWRGRAGSVAVVAFFSALAVLIGMSRVYLGVHWPRDVLAGWCFGRAWALLVGWGIGGWGGGAAPRANRTHVNADGTTRLVVFMGG